VRSEKQACNGLQVLGVCRFRGDARETRPRLVIRRPKARRVALLQHHVHAANDWLSLHVSSPPWPVPSSTSAHPLFALLSAQLLAGPQPSARVMLRRLRPVRCHGSRALEIDSMKPFTAGPRMARHGQSHVTMSPLVRQLHRAATAARFPVPLGVESTYRYVERDWLSTGGPTLLSEMPPSRDPDSRSLPL
jgi:hypothetical protein